MLGVPLLAKREASGGQFSVALLVAEELVVKTGKKTGLQPPESLVSWKHFNLRALCNSWENEQGSPDATKRGTSTTQRCVMALINSGLEKQGNTVRFVFICRENVHERRRAHTHTIPENVCGVDLE